MANIVDIRERSFECRIDGIRIHVMAGQVEMAYPPPKMATELLSPAHTHAWYELFSVIDGTLSCRFENTEFTLTPGEMLLIHPGLSHYTVPNPENADRIVLNFDFEILPDATGEAEELFRSLEKIDTYRVFRPGPECETAALNLSKALAEEDGVLSGPYCYALLLLVARSLLSPFQNGERKMKEMLSDSRVGRLYQLDQIFRYYYMCNLSLSDIASHFHLSSRQLARIIRKQYGCSYLEKVIEMRMEAASRLLSVSDKTVAEIAEEVGYSSLSCFYTAFRNKFGILPKDYRTIARQKTTGEQDGN